MPIVGENFVKNAESPSFYKWFIESVGDVLSGLCDDNGPECSWKALLNSEFHDAQSLGSLWAMKEFNQSAVQKAYQEQVCASCPLLHCLYKSA